MSPLLPATATVFGSHTPYTVQRRCGEDKSAFIEERSGVDTHVSAAMGTIFYVV